MQLENELTKMQEALSLASMQIASLRSREDRVHHLERANEQLRMEKNELQKHLNSRAGYLGTEEQHSSCAFFPKYTNHEVRLMFPSTY